MIEKQSSEEEMQPINNNSFCVSPSPFFFHLALDAFPDIGLVGWIEKKETKKKKSQEVSE